MSGARKVVAARGRHRSLVGSLAVRAASRIFRNYTAIMAREFERCARQTALTQAAVLGRIAVATARTEYGRHHGVQAGADYESWREKLPIVDWEDVAPWIAEERERPGSLVGDPVVQWTRSRCGSCGHKLVPYTSSLKNSFARALSLWGHDLLSSGLKLRRGYCYLEIDPPEVRWRGTAEIADDADYVAGPIAALMRYALVVDSRARELRSSESFSRVVALSLIAAPELEVISLFHPSEFLTLLDYIVTHSGELAALLDTGRVTCENMTFEFARPPATRRAALLAGDLVQLWPELKIVSTPAEHVDAPSAAEIARRLPHALHQGKGVLTTEAPLTIPLDRAGGMVPIVNEVFYELELDDGTVHRLQDAVVAREYTVVISQAGGLVRYRTGERVRVTHHWHSLPCLQHVAYA
jgi:hypothetical protein